MTCAMRWIDGVITDNWDFVWMNWVMHGGGNDGTDVVAGSFVEDTASTATRSFPILCPFLTVPKAATAHTCQDLSYSLDADSKLETYWHSEGNTVNLEAAKNLGMFPINSLTFLTRHTVTHKVFKCEHYLVHAIQIIVHNANILPRLNISWFWTFRT